MRDSFIFYRSFYEAIKDCNDVDQLALFKAIFEFGLNESEVNLTGLQNTLFKLIKPQLSANTKRYCDGRRGGRPPKITSGYSENKPLVNNKITSGYKKNKPNKNVNVNVNDNVNVNVNVNDNKNVNELFGAFLDMRKKIKKPATPEAIELLKNKLLKYTDDVKIKMLEKSITSNWQDLYELKEEAGVTAKKIVESIPRKENKW
jgi:hypothetical protein